MNSKLASYLGLGALVLSGAALPLLRGSRLSTPLGTWIWLALWAPAAGALSASMRPRWLAPLPALAWACALLANLVPAPHVAAGTLAVLSLFLLGMASASWVRRPWALAAGWLALTGALGALPSAGGIWLAEPGAAWLVPALDASPIVWVCESAGFDWMRHDSVYASAGSGDLAPDQRLAWSGTRGPWLALGIAGLLMLLRPGLLLRKR